MTRRAQVLISALVVVVFAAPGLAALVGVRIGSAPRENRLPAELPQLTASAPLDEQTYAEVAAWLTDRLPLRDRAISAAQRLERLTSMNEAVRAGVPIGDDGWLYHWDTLQTTCTGAATPDDFLARVGRTTADLADVGIPFVFVVVPDKVSIYPEHQRAPGLVGLLGLSSTEVPPCTAEWNEGMGAWREDAATSVDGLVLLHRALAAGATDPDDPVYWKRDTHWTDRGQMTIVEAVVDRLGGSVAFDPGSVRRSDDRVAEGDLTVLRGEEEQTPDEVLPGYDVVRPGVRTSSEQLSELEGSYVVARWRSTTTDAPLVPGSTWVFGDSSAYQATAVLAPWFEELVFVSWQTLEQRPLGDLVAEVGSSPDAVVVEMIQRNVAGGDYAVPLDALATLDATGG